MSAVTSQKLQRFSGITPQAASRAVSRLESHLGSRLFRRSTRSVQATKQGHAYYQACQPALSMLRKAELQLTTPTEVLAGTVRVSVPTTYGHHFFLHLLVEFMNLHPQIECEVEVSNHNTDFVRESYDLAVRMGAIKNATLIARKLGDFKLGVFASPSYLNLHGYPQKPEDILEHQCITFIMPSTGRVLPWIFGKNAKQKLIPPARIKLRGDVLGLVNLASAGGGLIQIYHYVAQKALERGQLIEVLKDYELPSRPFSLVYPESHKNNPLVQTLSHFIMDRTVNQRT